MIKIYCPFIMQNKWETVVLNEQIIYDHNNKRLKALRLKY